MLHLKKAFMTISKEILDELLKSPTFSAVAVIVIPASHRISVAQVTGGYEPSSLAKTYSGQASVSRSRARVVAT